ncbi:MAG: hypothetical protein HYY17_10205 [Planctomycetes bacterium]|nr:hypothetical protein [Planctomycetota bacterium]
MASLLYNLLLAAAVAAALSAVPRAWAAGTTDLGGGRTLVVSRGIGHERADAPRLRFLCGPEIVIVAIGP